MTTLHAQTDRPPTPNDGVYYPESDGEPVAETPFHYVPATYATSALSVHFEERPDVYVGGDMFIYFRQGDPSGSVAPDVFAIPNLDKRLRSSYFMWLEGQVPMFIMEVTSNGTWREDVGRKRNLYESWGVAEYWMYDPTQETRLDPLLQGFRLVDGAYEPIEIEVDPDSGLCRGVSSVLNLELHGKKDWFRFFNPSTGEYIDNLSESIAARREAQEERVRAEEERDSEFVARISAEQERDSQREARIMAERERDDERARLREMERLLREHGIEPPS
jgi:hypothetical protein